MSELFTEFRTLIWTLIWTLILRRLDLTCEEPVGEKPALRFGYRFYTTSDIMLSCFVFVLLNSFNIETLSNSSKVNVKIEK